MTKKKKKTEMVHKMSWATNKKQLKKTSFKVMQQNRYIIWASFK